MARSTGPILLVGAVTLTNESIIHGRPVDWRIPIATGAAAGVFALLEKGFPDVAVALAWLALGVTVLIRTRSETPAPIESITNFLEGTKS